MGYAYKYTWFGADSCGPDQKKVKIFRKIKQKVLVIRKIVVPLYRVKEITRRTGPVPGKKRRNENDKGNRQQRWVQL